MIHSSADGNTADCDLVFCGKRSGCGDGEGHTIDCYYCELDPDRYHARGARVGPTAHFLQDLGWGRHHQIISNNDANARVLLCM